MKFAPREVRWLSSRMQGLALAFALFGIVVGAKWATLFFFGSDIPNWDQWDAEAAHLLTPWFEGGDFLAELFHPHNEHYVILTKLQALGLVLLNGQWDARLECVVNAMLHAVTAAACWYGISRVAPRRWWLPAFLITALLFGLPLAWENIVNGFHSQQYWLIASSLAAIALLPFERTWSAAWWLGAVAAILALGSMASGFLAGAVALVMVGFQGAARHRSFRSVTPVVLLGAALIVFGFATRVDFPAHASLGAHSFHDFFLSITHSLAWPIRDRDWVGVVLWLPWFLVTVGLLINPRQMATERRGRWQLTAAGTGLWVLVQILAAAYARGAEANYPAIRYADTLAIGSLANALCLICLLSRSAAERTDSRGPAWLNPSGIRTYWIGAAWLAGLVFGLHETLHRNFSSELPGQREYYQHAEAAVRRYIATNDPAELAVPDIPYPDPAALVERLSHPALRGLMPASIRAPLELQTAKSSSANAFVTGGLSPGTPALIHPTWGSFHGAGLASIGRWMSEPVSSPLGGWLKFETAGQLGKPGTALEIHDAVTGVSRDRVFPSRVAGDNWRAAYAEVSDRPFVVVAEDNDPTRWFGFSAPVEMGRWSYRAWLATKHGLLVLYLSSGLAILIGLLGFWFGPRFQETAVAPQIPATPLPEPEFTSLLNPSTWRLTWRPILLGVVAVCALLLIATPNLNRVTALRAGVEPTIEGTFKRDGQFPGQPLADAIGVRVWGSWSGSDENTGTLKFGPFPAPQILRFAVGGYPDQPGIEVFVEHAGKRTPLPVPHEAVGEKWKVIDCPLPAEWVGTDIVLVARDTAVQKFGWIGISEPVRGGRGDGTNGFQESAAAWVINGLLLGIVAIAILRRLNRTAWSESAWLPLIIGGALAALGYLAFFVYLADNIIGVLFSVLLIAGAAADLWAHPEIGRASPEIAAVGRLIVAIGFFHLALLHLYPSPRSIYELSADRYRENMPGDNMLSYDLGSTLFHGRSPRSPNAEWQSSDRPPLQAGWQLLTWPVTSAFQIADRTASGTSAIWFQLLWVPAAFGLLRTLGLAIRRAAAWTAAMGLGGFFIQNTVFTWPKLSAGAFVLGTFGLWLLPRMANRRLELCVGAALATLGWLSHGGVAFSLLAMIPWIIWRAARGEVRHWLAAAAVFAVFALPWLGYQKLYDPPGNRLLKMHFAGGWGLDRKGVWESIHDSYSTHTGWEIVAEKIQNFRYQVAGDWRGMFAFSREGALGRRSDEFFLTGRALTWWLLGLIVVPWLVLRRPPDQSRPGGMDLITLGGWLALTFPIWCGLMWSHAVVHQGSYALTIGLFILCSGLLELASPWFLAVVVVLQAATLASTYAVPNETIGGPPTGLPMLIAGAIPMIGFVVAGYGRGQGLIHDLMDYLGSLAPRAQVAVKCWWENPTLTWWVFAVLAVALGLRHPSALHTPQLWAEDGSIFLLQNDQLGAGAFVTPYAGYLHTIPRLTAWLASHLLDVRWWPAFYNWTAFALWVAIIARIFSPRLKLPGKPWLALACFLGPQTGEILFNITNLQWITGLALVQLALLERPSTPWQQLGDLLWLAVIGLTGPFVIIFLPLFLWRWWSDRTRANVTLGAMALACAGIQGWFLLHAGPSPDPQPNSVSLWPIVVVLGRRLIGWPALGDQAALAMPVVILGLLGGGLLMAIVVRAFRPDPLRTWRAPLAAAFVLMVLAAVVRTRPDGWGNDNLYFGDRYFYIPRVLLAWLLILEFNASSRFVASSAKVICLLIALVHLRPYAVAAPPDYDWAGHCDPIRRGARANIPTLPEGWILEYPGRGTPR